MVINQGKLVTGTVDCRWPCGLSQVPFVLLIKQMNLSLL